MNVCVVDRYDKGYETVAPQHAMARHLAEVTRAPALDRHVRRRRLRRAGLREEAPSPRSTARSPKGAIGVKVYKSLGMELRSASGAYLLPDDPAFEPVFAGLEARGTTVYAHIAEPIAAWLPLDPKNPDYDYYQTNPAWHVHGRPGVPTKEAILAARDRAPGEAPEAALRGLPPRQHGGGRGRDRAGASTATRTSPWTPRRGSST